MANGKRRHDWDQTAALCATLANCNRDPKRTPRPYSPDDFNPMVQKQPRRKALPTPIDLALALGIKVSDEDRRRAAERYGVTHGE